MHDVVVSGVGVVSPIGVGHEAFWDSLVACRSGVKRLTGFEDSSMPALFGGEVTNYEPKELVRPRKSLKVMSRETQFAFGAAELACRDAGLSPGSIDPERLGIVFGADMMYSELPELANAFRNCMVDGRFDFSLWGDRALDEMNPLWLLKYLPNMAACHIGIAHNAQGPTNSITLGDVSGLLAIVEGARVIERGQADAVIVGGTGSHLHPTPLVYRGNYRLSHRQEEPWRACRPFDADRDGMVIGEGAGALILERRSHAERRGAQIWARVLAHAHGFEPPANGRPAKGSAIARCIATSLKNATFRPDQLGHINANGLSTIEHDQTEARVLSDALGTVPVIAPKSYFGNLGAGTGAVEIVASLLALSTQQLPATLNYERPDPLCPVNVVRESACRSRHASALVLNQATTGQSVAVLLGAP